MGLDACVYCDCVEKGKLRTPPPYPELLYIEEDGSPELRSDDLAICMEFDIWRSSSPCLHEDLCLTAHRLGNIGGISWIRSVIQQITLKPESDFPILWKRVIYSGTHAGDFLTPEEAVQLGTELQLIESANSKAYVAEQESYWEMFIGMMKELVEASRLIGKPISF